MFESILAKLIVPEKVSWDTPKYLNIALEGEDKLSPYEIQKGASEFIHKQLGIKPNTSKEVNKLNEPIWKELRDYLLTQSKDNPDERNQFYFEKENLAYLVDNSYNLIDIYDAKDTEKYKELEEKLQKFILDVTTTDRYNKFFTDGSGGLFKLICYDKNINPAEQDYTPIVIIEFNNAKSNYKIYTGILVYDTFTFIPNISPYSERTCLSDFILFQDIETPLQYAKDTAADLYESYLDFKENSPEISARELISLLKNVGYKLVLKTDDQLETIENLKDKVSNKRIQDFFNTFTFKTGETAYNILSLSELQKIFRYNELTLLDVLSILSKEYLEYEGSKITADILGTIVFNLHDKKNDKKQVETLRKEIEEN